MSFFDTVVALTREAQGVSHQLEKDAGVLTRNIDRRVKQLVRSRAVAGEMSATVDVNTLSIDFMSRWSVKQLLFQKITDAYVPVTERLFSVNHTPFKEFRITEGDRGIFTLDWSHGLVKEERDVIDRVPPIVVPTEAEVEEFLKSVFNFSESHA